MGADLLLGYLVIPQAKDPDFGKARELLARLSDEEVVKRYEDTEEHDWGDGPLSPEEFESAVRLSRADAALVIDDVEAGWECRRDFCTIRVDDKNVLISADMSYGDEPEGTRAIRIFADMGLAEAAGFVL